ncbi:MAG: ribulose-phosphate 3-epimerase [Planctomycetota bacterium]|nr:ribulose-phosphate 3-epimerase [Planctomycetota bacterium]
MSAHPPHPWPSNEILVAPSILAADFAKLAEDTAQSLEAGGDLLHVDVMDGHFVPNLTFGPALVRDLRRALPTAFLDVHLMVENPAMFVGPFVEAGADHVTFHVEPIGLAACVKLAERVRSLGATAGVAVNPPTPIEAVLPELVGGGGGGGAFDLVLVMSVNPGFGGQAFMPEVLEKVEKVRAKVGGVGSGGGGAHRLEAGATGGGATIGATRIEMDGGISPETAGACRAAGCDVLVAGSAVFGLEPGARADAIRGIRGVRGVSQEEFGLSQE